MWHDHDHRFGDFSWSRFDIIFLNFGLLIVLFILYLLNERCFKDSGLLFFQGYFNDLLASPLLLSYSNLLIATARRVDLVMMSLFKVFVLTLFASLLWEGLAPFYVEHSVADMVDVVCYFIGGFLYFVLFRWLQSKGRKGTPTIASLSPGKSNTMMLSVAWKGPVW